MTPFLSKCALALALATMFASGPSHAQAPAATPPAAKPAVAPPTQSHLDAARALIDLTGVLESVDNMLPTFAKEIKQQNITRPDLGKDLDVVLAGLAPEMQLQRAQIYTVVSRSYAKYYSEEELRALVAFFKTPLGLKFLKNQSELIDDITDAVTAWSQQVSEYIMVRTRAEMAKRGFQMQ